MIARKLPTLLFIYNMLNKIAEEIAEHPDIYPGYLVAAAESKCKEIVASKIVPVGKIADSENWFSS